MNNKTICSMRFAPALMTLTLALLTARPALAQHQLWIRQFGTSEADITFGAAPDGAGGVMVTGYTWGSLGGPSAGVKDVFLAHYDGAGNQLWIRQFGTRTYDRGLAIATDGARGVFVGGVTTGSLGGPYVGRGWDVFLARYDHAGNQIWIRQFGARNDGRNLALAPDGAGGVMVAGPTSGSPGGPNAGSYDAFLARYDSEGNQLWIRQFGTSAGDRAGALAPDGAGGVLVAGWTYGNLGGRNAGGADV
ncbi:MAG: hypothetical protein IIB55_09780, partial [Planctomycetes bacterium]|nr:hypothetical protein [Planctomycetota bacterium]